MRDIAKAFFDICLLRLRPQDLPASDFLLGGVLVTYALCSAIIIGLARPGLFGAVTVSLVDTALLVAMTVSVLAMQGLKVRINQALTALAGTGTLFGLMALPLVVAMRASEAQGPTVWLDLVQLGLLGWNMAVVAHILRHALSAPYYLGLVLAFVFFLLSHSVVKMVFSVVG